MPAPEIAKRDIQPRVNAALDNGLGRKNLLSRRKQLLDCVTGVAMDEQHSWPTPNCRLPSGLRDDEIR
jgi:hypothetical protein